MDRTDGVHLRFAGAEGLAALAEGAVVATSPDPSAFRAESVTTDYAGVVVARLRASASRLERRVDDRGIILTLIIDGPVSAVQGGAVTACAAGDLVVGDATDGLACEAADDYQLAWLFVPADRLPPRMLAPGAMPRGPLPETRLATSVAAFLRRLASGPPVGQGPDRMYLARAVAELAVAVVAEAMGDELPIDPAAQLRARVRDHIERHLVDPELGPQGIAAALGVSVRYVHRVFNVEGDTVSKYIRDQRLEAVARLLRIETRPQRVGALAERFGFSGRDHLTRAFRQRFGVTPREYQEAAALDAVDVLAGTRLPG